jgi:hypothetical protein
MRYFLIAISLLSLSTLRAEETLFSDIESGGWGGPSITVTSISGHSAFCFGGRGGWTINHTLTLGGAGMGMVTDIMSDRPGVDSGCSLTFGYGGGLIEVALMSDRVVHPTISLLIGAGGVGYRYGYAYATDGGMSQYNGLSRTVFVLEPGVSVELNLVHFMRIAMGATYRLVTGVDLAGYANKDFSGISGAVTFKFGTF